MEVRWLGNSCLEVYNSDSDKNYLIDPNFLVEPKKEPDFVLLTHEHNDHFKKEIFQEIADESDLYAPKTALDKFGIGGNVIKAGDVVNNVKVLDCDCYGTEESVCFYEKGLLHTADSSDFPIVDEVKVLFSACFEDLYENYVDGAKNLDPDLVIPYHYNPKEELNLAKGLKKELVESDVESEILELGETLKFNY